MPKVSVLRDERGVIIPILAVMGVVIFIFLGLLGIDSANVQSATSKLRADAATICYSLLELAPTQAAASSSFAAQVNNLATDPFYTGGLVSLQRARLIIPTMPTDFGAGGYLPSAFNQAGQFSAYGTSTLRPFTTPGIAPALPPSTLSDICSATVPTPNGSLPILDPGCQTAGGAVCLQADPVHPGFSRCVFQGDIYYGAPDYPAGSGPVTTSSTRFPDSMMNNLTHAGNTVICELEANVASTIPALSTIANRPIRARVGYRISAQGNYAPPTAPLGGFTDLPTAGLSIAVAPHMTTFLSAGFDNRFVFNPPWLTNPPPQPNAISWADVDPLAGGHVQFFSPNVSGVQREPVLSVDTTSIPAQLGPSAQELALGCMNPAVLVRNVIVSTILELAARHGQLRNTTEFLLVGTQHRDPAATNQLQGAANYPAIIVPFGYDLAARMYQLPFVSYFSGASSLAVPAPFGFSKIGVASGPQSNANTFRDGFVNPFSDITLAPYNESVATAQFHAVLANQLRFCYHLYSSNIPLGGLRGTSRLLPALPSNAGFEDLAAPNSAGYTLVPALKPSWSNADPWAQNCPWQSYSWPGMFGTPPGSPGPGVCADNPLTGSRHLSAAEVASIIGTIQQCPISGLPNGLVGPDAFVCSKTAVYNDNNPPPGAANPQVATLDLRPDLVGLLRHLTLVQQNLLQPGTPPTTDFTPAVSPPGAFPFRRANLGAGGPAGFPDSGLVDLRYPFSNNPPNNPSGGYNWNNAYQLPVANDGTQKSTNLLLFLHQRVNGPLGACNCNTGFIDETCALSCLTNPTSNPGIRALDPVTGPRRPITLVYLPTTAEDGNIVAYNNLLTAFNVNSGSPNLIIPIIPSAVANDPNATFLGWLTQPPSKCPGAVVGGVLLNNACTYRALWHWMLAVASPTSQYSAYGLANWIFFNRIVKKSTFF
ncbi:MAG: hypothetical protein K1X79_03085 [Oligoflexia bacterium]|nr:hypothetical protein [Oligoflexia bacterium]